MSKDPMRVLPEDLFPPEAATPEERFELLGRRLFAADPEQVKNEQDKPVQKPAKHSGPKDKPQGR